MAWVGAFFCALESLGLDYWLEKGVAMVWGVIPVEVSTLENVFFVITIVDNSTIL